MSRVLLASLCIGALAAAAWAQPPPDQPERRGEGRRGQRPERGAWAGRMFDRIADELQLDDEQRSQFEEIMATQRERMREREQRWTEVRRAEREGDEERAAQLRAELGEWRGPGSGIAEALDEIEPILRDDQLARLWEIQDRMQRRGGEGERYRRVVRELPDELDLDEAQREEFDRILRSERERMRERWSEMRPLMDELRRAGEAGDTERVEELRRQLEEARSRPDSMLANFFKELEQVLNEEQLKRLAAYRERLEGGGPGEREGPTDVRNVLRAVKRLRLSTEQKDELNDIEREAIGQYRKIGRRNQEEQAHLAAAVKKEIVAVLDAEQVKQLEQELQRLERRNQRGR
jgi:Spy/CpxP family protein refolding chaperone